MDAGLAAPRRTSRCRLLRISGAALGNEPRYDSIFPAVQNILLACRGLGLGACLTTLHTVHEREIHARLGIPSEYASPAMIPIGYPADRHGPIRRRPAAEVTRWERW